MAIPSVPRLGSSSPFAISSHLRSDMVIAWLWPLRPHFASLAIPHWLAQVSGPRSDSPIDEVVPRVSDRMLVSQELVHTSSAR